MLKPGERLDNLFRGNLRIIQHPGRYCFGQDAVLLAHFPKVAEGLKVIDLGSGTGVIPLLLTTRARGLKITGVEIQKELVDISRRTVALNGLESSIQIVQGDLLKAPSILGRGQWDLVVSNPPYFPSGQGRLSKNAELAVARHEICCSLADVIRVSSELLRVGGRLALIHRPQRIGEIFRLAGEYGLSATGLRLVQDRWSTPPKHVLWEGVKGRNGALLVMPTLVLRQENGEYFPEAQLLLGQ